MARPEQSLRPTPTPGKADFQVLGPRDPVQAVVGEDAELRCWLSPNISGHGMELRWFREQLSPAVHVHRAGRDEPEEQMPAYRGRTSFVDRDLAGGEAAVLIHQVTPLDNGSYHCLFTEGRARSGTTLWLQVVGEGSTGTSCLPGPTWRFSHCDSPDSRPQKLRSFPDTCAVHCRSLGIQF